MTPDPEERRRTIAYHEAGHAVVAFVLKVPFDQISVVSDGESAGRVTGSHQRGFYASVKTDARVS